MERFLITQSLLYSWNYQFTDFYDVYSDENVEAAIEGSRESFLSALRREKTPTTEAQQRGLDFEELVVLITEGKSFEELMEIEAARERKRAESGTAAKRRSTSITNWEQWYEGANHIAEKVRGGAFQVAINDTVKAWGMEFVIHGKLDALKNGTIYDIKSSGRYEYGNYLESAQHPMYFALVPEAHTFSYLVYSDKRVFEESYRREDTRSISDIIAEFMEYLEVQGLMSLYREKWLAL